MEEPYLSQTSYPSVDVVCQLIKEIIRDHHVRELFFDILSEKIPAQDQTQKDLLRREAILNGSFYMTTQCYTACYYIPQLLEYGFPSSMSRICNLNQALWDKTIEMAKEQGHTKRDTLAKFILVWAAMDGSILSGRFEVIVPDDETMIKFFVEIITYLHEGVQFSHSVYREKSEDGNCKDIAKIRVSSPYKLCNVSSTVLDDDDKYVPHKKADMCRRHAATWDHRVSCQKKPAAAATIKNAKNVL